MSERTPVDELEGRELDCAVAEEVMGLRICHDPGCAAWGGLHEFDEGEEIPHYSTDIAAAWEVVDRMKEVGRFPEIRFGYDGWYAIHHEGDHHCGHPCVKAGATESTPPEAICRAALKAVRS